MNSIKDLLSNKAEILDARVEFASGEMAKFSGSREQLIQFAKSNNVKAAVTWSDAEHIMEASLPKGNVGPVERVRDAGRKPKRDRDQKRIRRERVSLVRTARVTPRAGVSGKGVPDEDNPLRGMLVCSRPRRPGLARQPRLRTKHALGVRCSRRINSARGGG